MLHLWQSIPFHSYENCPKEIASRKERVPETYDYRSQYDAYEYDTYHANYNIEIPTQEYHYQGQRQDDVLSFDEKYDKLMSMIESNKEANRRYEASFAAYDTSFKSLETHVDRLLDRLNKDETYESQGIIVLDFDDEDEDEGEEQNEEFTFHSTNTMEWSAFGSSEVTHIQNPPQLPRVAINQVGEDDSVFENKKEQEKVSLVKDEHHVVERCHENSLSKLTHIIVKKVHRKARVTQKANVLSNHHDNEHLRYRRADDVKLSASREATRVL
nr:hypothetical protein [Tanacetum cinerariifolium]